MKPRLQTLRSSVQTLKTTRSTIAATDRIRGRALQAIRHRILRRDAGICRCSTCQRTGALKAAHEVEHRIPLWAGGTEDDSNRYAINVDCHAEKTRCEAAMRAQGGFEPGACTCGRHMERPTALVA